MTVNNTLFVIAPLRKDQYLLIVETFTAKTNTYTMLVLKEKKKQSNMYCNAIKLSDSNNTSNAFIAFLNPNLFFIIYTPLLYGCIAGYNYLYVY